MPRNARVIAITAETLTESIIIKNTGLMDKEGGKINILLKRLHVLLIFLREEEKKEGKVQEE